MLVARWYNNADIRLEEVPAPTPGPHEMLVKITACGICGSDIRYFYGENPWAKQTLGRHVGPSRDAGKGHRVRHLWQRRRRVVSVTESPTGAGA